MNEDKTATSSLKKSISNHKSIFIFGKTTFKKPYLTKL